MTAHRWYGYTTRWKASGKPPLPPTRSSGSFFRHFLKHCFRYISRLFRTIFSPYRPPSYHGRLSLPLRLSHHPDVVCQFYGSLFFIFFVFCSYTETNLIDRRLDKGRFITSLLASFENRLLIFHEWLKVDFRKNIIAVRVLVTEYY